MRIFGSTIKKEKEKNLWEPFSFKPTLFQNPFKKLSFSLQNPNCAYSKENPMSFFIKFKLKLLFLNPDQNHGFLLNHGNHLLKIKSLIVFSFM